MKLILVVPDLDKKIRMKVDTLDYTMEEVLLMECEDGKQRPVAYLSKLLNKTERNYEIHDKEILAVIKGLENWRHMLENTKFKFKIQTDYINLEYFMKVQKLNKRQARWTLYLSKFDFSLKHIPEIKMEKIDSLSRKLDWKIEVERDNKDQVFIKDH